ncbi:hypothetical protein BC628DRAFT_2521 [Trametes gibbosa]|nr:hypothetical protein BC628DRAFT_2521 [Trametes gibbosa]
MTSSSHGRTYGVPDLPYVVKPRTPKSHTWQSLVGLNPYGDMVYVPTELPERRPSPIGSRRRCVPSTVSSNLQSPLVRNSTQAAQDARPPREDLRARGHSLARPSSAPPTLYLRPLSALPEEDERHLPSECQGDPLCATHRKRPIRSAGPHKRTPLQLWQGRPKFGQKQCSDIDCTDRRCADCTYLRSRGNAVWMQLARPSIETKLRDVDVFAPRAEYTERPLALLRLRATFQVRRTMG